jgi:signal transduction histidine kinase
MGNYAAGKVITETVNQQNITRVEPELSCYLVIKLDENTVNKFISDLAARHFSDSETSNYNVSIFKKFDSKIIYQSSQIQTKAEDASDASIEIFDISNESFRMIVNSRMFTKNKKNITDTERQIIEKNIPPAPRMNPADSLKVFFDNQRKREPEVKNKGLWLLKVQHTDGSLDQFIDKARRKNLAVSFGILALLAASGILILVSAQRAKLLAQRQIDFVSAVSHEFRTPLAVIYSAGENLTDGVVNSEKQITQYGNLIKREGKKLSSMVEQILEFAGARSGRKKYDLRSTNVKSIIEKALAECQSIITEKDFEVELEIAENLPRISADANALSHTIQNLIINAVKYSDRSRWIKISAANGGGYVKIAVEDKGIGIAPKDVSNIFTPFYRAKSVVDAQIHGNGLGLSLVKQTVEAHGGKILVETKAGKGSKFTIQLLVNSHQLTKTDS